MKNKKFYILNKFLATITLVMVLFPCLNLNNFVYAAPAALDEAIDGMPLSLFDDDSPVHIHEDVKPAPGDPVEIPKPSEDDSNGPAKPEKKEEEIEWKHFYEVHPVRAEGEVTEEVEFYTSSSSLEETGSPTSYIPVSGVKVTADGDSFTDESGEYEPIEGPFEGNIEFYYGDITDTPNDGKTSLVSMLSHNGFDYDATLSSTSYNNMSKSITEREIIASSRGAVQLFFLIDCSKSMLVDDEVTGKSKFDYCIESTKLLIHELLSIGGNIYIGIVSYADEAYLTAGITDNEEHLMERIDVLVQECEDFKYASGSTNLNLAIEKAMKHFYIDKSDPDYLDNCIRNIVIVSDGVPTAYDDHLVTAVNTPQKNKEEFKAIIDLTLESLNNLQQNEKINFMSLVAQSASDPESLKQVISLLYSYVGEFIASTNAEELAGQIESKILPWIEEIKKENPNIQEYNSKTTINGQKDSIRQKVLEDNFSGVFAYNRDKEKTNKTDINLSDNSIIACSNTVIFSAIDKLNELQSKTNKTIYSLNDIDTCIASLPDKDKVKFTDDEIKFLKEQIKLLSDRTYMKITSSKITLEERKEGFQGIVYGKTADDSNADYYIEYDREKLTNYTVDPNDENSLRIDQISGDLLVKKYDYYGYSEIIKYYPKHEEPVPDLDENGQIILDENGHEMYTQGRTASVHDGTEDPTKTEYNKYHYFNTTIDVSLTLRRKEHFTLYTSIAATGIQITLNEDTVLVTTTDSFRDENGRILEKPLLAVLDEDVSHGATIKVEYTIEVKNVSPVICTYFSLVSYLPKDFYVEEDGSFITERGSNADYNWKSSSLDYLNQSGYISNDTYQKYENINVATTTVDGIRLARENSIQFKLVATRVIHSADDLTEEITCDAEILEYRAGFITKTSDGELFDPRRMTLLTSYTKNAVQTNKYLLAFLGVYPGDTKDDYKLSDIYNASKDATLTKLQAQLGADATFGVDYSKSANPVFIVPPTGNNKYHNEKTVIIALSITLLASTSLLMIFKKRKSK